ncbi:MAG: hypothetical protein ACLVD8_27495 [Enterocloster sp.]|uniref:hypothetical protein n=1 Tax=Enterocloster sp. TaxID=2719315 RepID=UPI00399970A0
MPVVDAGEETMILGNSQELERLEQEEQQSDFPGRLWDGLRKRYPKIQAFDSANGCEILTFKPQDIGLLPRENWNYGNNSFLLHGYYNYRYLILARIGDETKGRTRYILGVPGNYYSNEKYMASMFGFPHFVLAKKTAVTGRPLWILVYGCTVRKPGLNTFAPSGTAKSGPFARKLGIVNLPGCN